MRSEDEIREHLSGVGHYWEEGKEKEGYINALKWVLEL